MNGSLEVGGKHVNTFQVDEGRTIDFMGAARRVYATPSMVFDVESTCRNLLMLHQDAGEDSVGARVVIDHIGPTLLGQFVTITAKVSVIELPRVTFEFEVKDELDVVGKGTHIRYVIDVDKQIQRLAKKIARIEDQALGCE